MQPIRGIKMEGCEKQSVEKSVKKLMNCYIGLEKKPY